MPCWRAIRSPIEVALRGYRDRVVAAGGVCYIDAPDLHSASLAAQVLGAAVVATAGELYLQHGESDRYWSDEFRQEMTALLRLRHDYPALCAGGTRQQLNSSDDTKYYAFLRRSNEAGAPVLVVMNFQPEPQSLSVDLTGLPENTLTNILTGEERPRRDRFEVSLPAYGFSLWALTP